MKHYVAIFEEFEEKFDNFYQKQDMQSDSAYQSIANDLIELANQYTNSEIDINEFDEDYGTATRIYDLEDALITRINDEMGEDVANDFAEEADELIQSLEISEKKKQIEPNIDEVDFNKNIKKKATKTNSKPIEKTKMFGKKTNIEDNGFISQRKGKKFDNLEEPGITQNLRPSTSGRK